MANPPPQPQSPVDALLLVATHCPHCQTVLDGLASLVKTGAIGRLCVINVHAEPQAPEARGVRSVPWLRLGPFELAGALTAGELAQWAASAASGAGWGRYFAQLIEDRRLEAVAGQIERHPATLRDLLALFAAVDTGLSVRIGISAVMESLDRESLRYALPEISALAGSDSPQIRADACYFLGLAGDPNALPTVLGLRDDTDPTVREVAAEVLDLLEAG